METFLSEKGLEWSIPVIEHIWHPDFNSSTTLDIEKVELPITKKAIRVKPITKNDNTPSGLLKTGKPIKRKAIKKKAIKKKPIRVKIFNICFSK
jgi:hypothetical protein